MAPLTPPCVAAPVHVSRCQGAAGCTRRSGCARCRGGTRRCRSRGRYSSAARERSGCQGGTLGNGSDAAGADTGGRNTRRTCPHASRACSTVGRTARKPTPSTPRARTAAHCTGPPSLGRLPGCIAGTPPRVCREPHNSHGGTACRTATWQCRAHTASRRPASGCKSRSRPCGARARTGRRPRCTRGSCHRGCHGGSGRGGTRHSRNCGASGGPASGRRGRCDRSVAAPPSCRQSRRWGTHYQRLPEWAVRRLSLPSSRHRRRSGRIERATCRGGTAPCGSVCTRRHASRARKIAISVRTPDTPGDECRARTARGGQGRRRGGCRVGTCPHACRGGSSGGRRACTGGGGRRRVRTAARAAVRG